MAAKKSKADLAAAAKQKELRNPLTGQAPNSFTQSTNRELPAPTAVRPQTAFAAPERSRLRALHREATRPGGINDPVTGYGKPHGVEDRDWAWMTGAHHMFPNVAAQRGEPAINEPHAADPGVTVQRRAEDLSGPEYRKGTAVLANYGHDPRNPVRSLQDVQRQALHRVIGEHAAAGVEENASQHFYGGNPIQSRIPDDTLQKVHEEGVTEAHGRFLDGVDTIARHPAFQAATQGMSHRQRTSAATNLMAQSTADTSPNNRWRQGTRWPNLEQAQESATAALEHRDPKFIGGRIQNNQKAADRVGEMTRQGSRNGGGWPEGSIGEEANTSGEGERFAPHAYGNVRGAPKTVAFRGALVDQNAPDAYKVSDVHEAGNMLPGVSPSKGLHYRDSSGKRVVQYPDQPASRVRGMTQEMDPKNGKPDRGNARAENMLADSASTVHALNDHATRTVLAQHGLSRGVNYADNVHPMQAAAWGSQQVRRTDKTMADVSHASQYPVVRDWGAEGSAAGIHPAYQHMFHGVSGNLSPQFRENPNTSGVKNPMRRSYPLEPEIGEK